MFNAILAYAVGRGVAITFWRRLLPPPPMSVFMRALKQLYMPGIMQALNAESPFLTKLQEERE